MTFNSKYETGPFLPQALKLRGYRLSRHSETEKFLVSLVFGLLIDTGTTGIREVGPSRLFRFDDPVL